MPWISSNMYLLLPFDDYHRGNGLSIPWKAIDSCVSVVGLLKKMYSCEEDCQSKFMSDTDSFSHEMECQQADFIFLANISIEVQKLKNSVVLAIHTGKIYTVLDIIKDTTPEGPFDETHDTEPTFVSFMDYYYQKYKIVLQHAGQPLLLLKQSHRPHNLLSKSKYEGSFIDDTMPMEKEQVHARIPPELLVHIDISNDTLKSFYLLPSVMHRLESLQLACQLREEIGCDHGAPISCLLILEALTTVRCCEDFSLERLELLGDSVLKYIISCDLFLRYPNKHEGQLSDLRMQEICNATLHKLGINRSLQGYIRDSPFDPQRWVAPGQIPLRFVACTCGIDSPEVPLENKFATEETSFVIGKMCDKGHRWMCSKTIADCVEALIGAYFVAGSLCAAISCIKWLGFNVNLDIKLVNETKEKASRWFPSKIDEIDKLEDTIGHVFSVKGLLLEAVTHPSKQDLGENYCYQRLEFLGDSVLDLLITYHLFVKNPAIEPGELTDLRSASISNENFALAAVRYNLQNWLKHDSGLLSQKIMEYTKFVASLNENNDFLPSLGISKGPKVLGDMVESIAGAVLIDTDLALEKVWEVFEPLLSPIMTPERLSLPPFRELIEFCSHHGYFMTSSCTNEHGKVIAKIKVQLKDNLLLGHGCDKNVKAAKAAAAISLLKDLKKSEVSYCQSPLEQKHSPGNFSDEHASSLHFEISPRPGGMSDLYYSEKQLKKCIPMLTSSDLFMKGSIHPEKERNDKENGPVNILLKIQKGGGRTALFQLCKTLEWPMPNFEIKEESFRTPLVLNGMKTAHFNIFIATAILYIPKNGVIRVVGEQKTDKKQSQDSAAQAMLLELQKQGICLIREQ